MADSSSVFSLLLIQLLSSASASEAVFKKNVSALVERPPALTSSEIEETTRLYLKSHPEVIIEALQAYQRKQAALIEQQDKETLAQARQQVRNLISQPGSPVLGNPGGTVTLVEFSDYQCTHCLESSPVIDALIRANHHLRVVIKEFAIRGPVSELAAKAALAARLQGKYGEFRSALFQLEQPLTPVKIDAAAESAHLDLAKLKRDIQDKAIAKELRENQNLAVQLKLTGTPVFFVVKPEVKAGATDAKLDYIPGAVNREELQSVIDKINA